MRLLILNLILIIGLSSCNTESARESQSNKYEIIKSWSDPSQPVVGIDLVKSGDSLFMRANFVKGDPEVSPVVAGKVENSTIIRYIESNNYNGEYYVITEDSTLNFVNISGKVFRTIK